MRSWRTTIALAGVGSLLLSGCGESAQVKLQRREIAYQSRIGAINKPFSHPQANVARGESMLRSAISEYAAIQPPAPFEKLNAELVRALRRELRGYQLGIESITHPADAHRAQILDSSSRAEVSKLLRRIATEISACRADAANC